MSLFDRDLVRAINSGRCFALIGAGPSCEMGAPSWKLLAEKIMESVDPQEHASHVNRCQQLLKDEKYPDIFGLVEHIIGRDKLLSVVKSILLASAQRGTIYKYIASWPFQCYLSTNFDDYLSHHLEDINIPVLTRRNSHADIRVLRADTKNLIMKIHGDVSVPDDIVLTAEQYQEFREGESREYWRDKIFSVLNMVDLIVVGYSAKDPDFQDQLERAKKIAAPNKPVFMFAADFKISEIEEYYQKYNIRIIAYKNKDGSHQKLKKLFKRYDPFITKRGSSLIGLEPVDESTASLAASMYIFTQLRIKDSDDSCMEKIYMSAILQSLSVLQDGINVSVESIQEELNAKTFVSSNVDPVPLKKALEQLYSSGFISMSEDFSSITIESKGREAVLTIKEERVLIGESFHKACVISLDKEYPEMTREEKDTIVLALNHGLVQAYNKRGIEIARSVFSDTSVDVSGTTDILEIINRASVSLQNDNLRIAFADLMIEVILMPTEEMKAYLAFLAQGYFAYHALGLEPRCSVERLNMAKQKTWILDSSILLPVIAIGCMNHNYARDLLGRMKALGLGCYTTEKLYQEVLHHASWAISYFSNIPTHSPHFLQAAMAGPGFRQNLFLDGFVKWSMNKGDPSFHQYMCECLDGKYKEDLNQSIKSKVEEMAAQIVEFTNWQGMTADIVEEKERVSEDIQRLRSQRNTFRSSEQCDAEAEIILIGTMQEVVFLSQSSILNHRSLKNPTITWMPEAMYRFLALFSSVPTDADLLYECMTQDIYFSGFDIIDKKAIAQYAFPMVNQSRMDLDGQKEKYSLAIGEKKYSEFREGFERVPDEQKPFYSMQVAHYVASREIQRAESAENRATQAENIKQLTEKDKKDLDRLRRAKARRIKKAQKKTNKKTGGRKKKKKKKK